MLVVAQMWVTVFGFKATMTFLQQIINDGSIYYSHTWHCLNTIDLDLISIIVYCLFVINQVPFKNNILPLNLPGFRDRELALIKVPICWPSCRPRCWPICWSVLPKCIWTSSGTTKLNTREIHVTTSKMNIDNIGN